MKLWLRVTRVIVVLMAILFGCAGAIAQSSAIVTVFAAASLTNALLEVGGAFAKSGGGKVGFSFAGSSTLAKQIEQGADAHVFISADEAWMNYLDTRKLLTPGTRRDLLGNRLVLAVPAGAGPIPTIAQGGNWLNALPPGRIATGDPAHVPVGKYARQALTSLGVWGSVEGRLARADNVRNALVLVERGEAVAGIVYATDASISKNVTVAGSFPDGTHPPIVYPAALVRPHAGGEAERFLSFLSAPEAQEIFRRHGFTVR